MNDETTMKTVDETNDNDGMNPSDYDTDWHGK